MPLLLKKVKQQNVLAVWKIEEKESDLSRLLTFSKNMQLQLSAIICGEKRREWIASRILLQDIMQCVACVTYKPNGKPLLLSNAHDISISHTKGFAAVLVTNNIPAGIDIEYTSRRIARISCRFISKQERNHITENPDEQICSITWCAKEALYKMADTPGLSFKNNMRIDPFHLKNKGSLTGKMKIGQIWRPIALNYIATSEFHLVWHW